jgi:predicted metal-dependent phosphoesterase TrpH
MRSLLADLHIHTALSPCAADEMTPGRIVAAALDRGLAMIAICDHNSAQNAAAVQQAAAHRLTVIAGLEITTAEECHVLGYFPTADAALQADAAVRTTLPDADDEYSSRFGEQPVMRSDDSVVRLEVKALAMAAALDLTAAVKLIKQSGGIAVAAHIDRRAFGVIAQLGVFPLGAGFDAVEVSRHAAPGTAEMAGFEEIGLPIVHSSDSHFLDDIGSACTVVSADSASFDELLLALQATGGRSVRSA